MSSAPPISHTVQWEVSLQPNLTKPYLTAQWALRGVQSALCTVGYYGASIHLPCSGTKTYYWQQIPTSSFISGKLKMQTYYWLQLLTSSFISGSQANWKCWHTADYNYWLLWKGWQQWQWWWWLWLWWHNNNINNENNDYKDLKDHLKTTHSQL